MLKKSVIRHFGSVQKAAKAIKRHRSAVYQWPDDKPIPADAALRVEAASKGKLKADPKIYANLVSG